jgi:maltose alpha-D-glucosyltransferase/alpha-amylase
VDPAMPETPNQAILAFLRHYEGETILSINNLSSQAQSLTLDLTAYAGSRPIDLLSGEDLPAVTAQAYPLELKRHEYRWLRL